MKNYNKKFLISFFSVLFIIMVINYTVNPYNIFKQRFFKNLLKPEAKLQERYTKPIGLKIDKREISAIFMGTSRTDLAINKDEYKNQTGENAEVIAIGGLHFPEVEQMVNIALKIHPEIKKLFIAIDFNIFTKKEEDKKDNRVLITQDPKLQITEMCSALLSISTTGNSIWTIIKNLSGIEKRMFYYQGHKHIFVNKKIQKAFDDSIEEYIDKYNRYELDTNKVEKFKNYITSLNEKGIETKIFVMPTHISQQKFLDETGKREIYNLWLEKMTEIGDVWNFNIKNEYNEEEIKPDMQYFFDSSHATHKWGKLIIEDLLSNTPKRAVILPKKEAN